MQVDYFFSVGFTCFNPQNVPTFYQIGQSYFNNISKSLIFQKLCAILIKTSISVKITKYIFCDKTVNVRHALKIQI